MRPPEATETSLTGEFRTNTSDCSQRGRMEINSVSRKFLDIPSVLLLIQQLHLLHLFVELIYVFGQLRLSLLVFVHCTKQTHNYCYLNTCLNLNQQRHVRPQQRDVHSFRQRALVAVRSVQGAVSALHAANVPTAPCFITCSECITFLKASG